MSASRGQSASGRAQSGGGRGQSGGGRGQSASGSEHSEGGRVLAAEAAVLASEWAPVAGRVLLGLVLGWFGYHELLQPGLWTGYVPLVAPASSLAAVAVLAHGWVLLMLAVALAAGISPRLMAGVAAVVLAEIIISLTVTAGLSDLVMRDVGVFGLAVSLTGISNQRLALRR